LINKEETEDVVQKLLPYLYAMIKMRLLPDQTLDFIYPSKMKMHGFIKGMDLQKFVASEIVSSSESKFIQFAWKEAAILLHYRSEKKISTKNQRTPGSKRLKINRNEITIKKKKRLSINGTIESTELKSSKEISVKNPDKIDYKTEKPESEAIQLKEVLALQHFKHYLPDIVGSENIDLDADPTFLFFSEEENSVIRKKFMKMNKYDSITPIEVISRGLAEIIIPIITQIDDFVYENELQSLIISLFNRIGQAFNIATSNFSTNIVNVQVEFDQDEKNRANIINDLIDHRIEIAQQFRFTQEFREEVAKQFSKLGLEVLIGSK